MKLTAVYILPINIVVLDEYAHSTLVKLTAVPNQHSQYLVKKTVKVEVSSCFCQGTIM